jgi:hypothetical protein
VFLNCFRRARDAAANSSACHITLSAGVVQQLHLLVEGVFPTTMFRTLFAAAAAGEPDTDTAITRTSSFYGDVLCRWACHVQSTKGVLAQTGVTLALLNALAFSSDGAVDGSSFVANFWQYLRRRTSSNPRALIDNAEEKSGLLLFCSAYSHLQMVQTDDDTFKDQQYLPEAELKPLAVFLKDFLYQVYWVEPRYCLHAFAGAY